METSNLWYMNVRVHGESGQDGGGWGVTRRASGEEVRHVFACIEGIGYFSTGFNFLILAL